MPLLQHKQFYLLVYCFLDYLGHVINLFISHAGIYADPESIAHDAVNIFKGPHYAITFTALTHLVKAWVLYKVPCKQHPSLHSLALNIGHHFLAVYAIAGHHEAKPAWSGIGTPYRKNNFILYTAKIFI